MNLQVYRILKNYQSKKEDKSKFAQLFNLFNKYLEAAKIQRMTWDKEKYEFDLENGEREVITREIDEKHI